MSVVIVPRNGAVSVSAVSAFRISASNASTSEPMANPNAVLASEALDDPVPPLDTAKSFVSVKVAIVTALGKPTVKVCPLAEVLFH